MTRFAIFAILAACSPAPPAPVAPAPQPAPSPPALGALSEFGGLPFGVDADALRSHAGTPLVGEPSDPTPCYTLTAAGPDADVPPTYAVVYMIEDGDWTRVDVRDPAVTAPGGGKAGDTLDHIRELYGPRMTEEPHKYVEGGAYLRIEAPEGNGVLVFEVVDGQVSTWRLGVPPSIDYVEGCS